MEETEKKIELGMGVTVVAVSKTKSESDIMVAYNAGQHRDFGENYVLYPPTSFFHH
jgi:uncharacterized pyridoxal phosphate-containing UPF0001 family protein